MSRPDARDLDDVRNLYERSLDQHGVSSLGVGWRDDASHQLRFDKLASLIDSKDQVSVSDLGCGYGAFLDYLRSHAISVSRFRGYDISARMLELAAKRHPAGEWVLGSMMDTATDFAFACGIFNVRLAQDEDVWRAHVESTLDNLNAYSNRGFAFNLLSTYVDFREPHLFYGDPLYFFDLCKRRYSRRVALLHDYPLFEWTLSVKK